MRRPRPPDVNTCCRLIDSLLPVTLDLSESEVALRPPRGIDWKGMTMGTILWIIAAVLVIAGILALFRRQILWGIILIVVGLLVGPGGVSFFT